MGNSARSARTPSLFTSIAFTTLAIALALPATSTLAGPASNGTTSTTVAPSTSPTDHLEYPELLATPSATQRLQMEAQREDAQAWRTHLALQSSAAFTLFSGLISLSDPGRNADQAEKDGVRPNSYWAGITGVIVGGGWLTTSALLSSKYRPYQRGQSELKVLPQDGAPRARLARERLAEEAINAPAALGRKLTWLSVISNLGASAFVAASAANDSTRVVGGLSAAMAFAPVLFSYYWGDVASYQDDYKKRVYGPISRGGLQLDPVTLKPGIGYTLAWIW